MYYVKQTRFDFEAKKYVSNVLFSTAQKSIAVGMCIEFAQSALQSCRAPFDVTLSVYDGHTLIGRFVFVSKARILTLKDLRDSNVK